MAALGILLLQLIVFSAAADNACQFCYTEWPSSTLACSPYKSDKDLAIVCAAEGSAPLEIKWFYNNSSVTIRNDSKPLRNDSNYLIQTVYTTGTNRTKSRLRVKNVSAGNYWCQVYYNYAGVYPTSQVLSIADSNSYSRLEACTDSPKSELLHVAKCHSLACNTAGVLPTTTTATVTTITTTPPLPPLMATTPETPGITTTAPTSGSMVTPSSTGHSTIRVLPTRTSYPTPSPQGSLQDVPEPYQTWLFVVVALTAVFGMLIIILTIVCIGICLLRSRSNEVDCEKDEGKSLSNASHGGLPENRRPSTSMTQQTEIINCLPQTAIYSTLERDYEDIDDDKDEPFVEPGPLTPPAKPRYASQAPNSQPHAVPYYSALGAADAPATQHMLQTCDPAVSEQLTGYGKLDHSRPRQNYYPKKDSPLLSGYRKLDHVSRGFTLNSTSATLPHSIQNQGPYANITASHIRSSSLPDEGSIDQNHPSINSSPSPPGSQATSNRAYLNIKVIEEHEAMQRQRIGGYQMLEDATAEQDPLALVEGKLDLGGGGVQDYEFLPTVCSEGTKSYDNLQPLTGNEPDTSPARRALGMLAKDPMAEQMSVDSTHSGDFTGPFFLPHMVKFGEPYNQESDNHTYKALDLSSLEPDKNYAVPAAAKPKRRMKGL